MADKLTHLNDRGEARMVDVSAKPVSQREASATATVLLQPPTLRAVIDGNSKKGDVLAVARVAGIQAAKKCSDLIPLCHPLSLSKVDIDFDIDEAQGEIRITCRCRLAGQTGVEMEALTGASIAALTIYDMCKAMDKGIEITRVCLLEKSGGKSGDWSRAVSGKEQG